MLYVYTIILLALLFSACSLCGAGYAISHSKGYLVKAGLIGAYLLELVVLFGEEWSIQNVAAEVGANYYEIAHPLVHVALGGAMALVEWLTCDTYLGRSNHRGCYIAALAQMAAATASLLLPFGPVRQLLFYTSRQACFAACLLCAAIHYVRARPERRTVLLHNRRFFIALCALVALTALEDAWCILALPIPTEHTPQLMLLLSYRNIAENAMMLLLAWGFSKDAWQLIAAHFERPVGFGDDTAHETTMLPQIELMIPAFTKEHALTEREAEVLRLLLAGKSNRVIADELFVVEGTVKSHTHNIMKKVGVATRDELRRAFWES